MSGIKDKEIFLGPENYPLKIEVKTFKGKKYIDFRKWFLDRKTNEILPTKKGIMLSEYQFRDVSESIMEAISLIVWCSGCDRLYFIIAPSTVYLIWANSGPFQSESIIS